MSARIDEPWVNTGTHECERCGAETRDAVCEACAAELAEEERLDAYERRELRDEMDGEADRDWERGGE